MNKDGIRVTGLLEIFKLDRVSGNRIKVYEKKNLVVTTGLTLISDRLKTNSVNPLTHIAVGTGNTPVVPADVALQSELARKAVTDIDTIINVLTVETQFSETEANGTWEEVGIFNNLVAGTMFNRINVTYVKSSADPAIVRFTITFVNV